LNATRRRSTRLSAGGQFLYVMTPLNPVAPGVLPAGTSGGACIPSLHPARRNAPRTIAAKTWKTRVIKNCFVHYNILFRGAECKGQEERRGHGDHRGPQRGDFLKEIAGTTARATPYVFFAFLYLFSLSFRPYLKIIFPLWPSESSAFVLYRRSRPYFTTLPVGISPDGVMNTNFPDPSEAARSIPCDSCPINLAGCRL